MSNFWTWLTSTWRDAPDGCWVWRGRKSFKGQDVRATAKWFGDGATGPVLPGPWFPQCRNRRCVRPDHLGLYWPGRAGRKLTTEQAAEARAEHVAGSRTAGARALARRFGVSLGAMQKVLTGRTYK